MILKVLAIEDHQDQLDYIEAVLQDISPDQRERHGIEEIRVDKARSANEARRLLQRAKERKSLYDILLLDLSLPEREGEEFEHPDLGLEILDIAIKKSTAKEIIIVSVFDHYEYVAGAFRKGAVDFIAKSFEDNSYDPDYLQAQVLSSWDRILTKESARILDDRIKALIPYAEKGLAHQFSTCFSRLAQSVTLETERMEIDISERLGLDRIRDSQDPLVQRLVALGEETRTAKQEWVRLQSTIASGDDLPAECVVEELLLAIKEDLLPCLTAKRTELSFSPST